MTNACFRGPVGQNEGTNWLLAGLHGRNRWRLPVLLTDMGFAQGHRTVSTLSLTDGSLTVGTMAPSLLGGNGCWRRWAGTEAWQPSRSSWTPSSPLAAGIGLA